MKNKILLAFTIFSIVTLFTATLVSAGISVKPAKQGIFRLKLFPFTPATLTRSLEIKNLYDYEVQVSLSPTENFQDILNIENKNFTLQANESKVVEYVATIKEPGNYQGGIVIHASALNKTSGFAYQSDLTILVTKSSTIPEFYYIVIGLAIAVPVLFLIFKMSKKRRSKK